MFESFSGGGGLEASGASLASSWGDAVRNPDGRLGHAATLNPVAFWKGFVIDVTDCWGGASFLGDIDYWTGVPGATTFVNRCTLIAMSPYILVVFLFLGLAILHVIKLVLQSLFEIAERWLHRVNTVATLEIVDASKNSKKAAGIPEQKLSATALRCLADSRAKGLRKTGSFGSRIEAEISGRVVSSPQRGARSVVSSWSCCKRRLPLVPSDASLASTISTTEAPASDDPDDSPATSSVPAGSSPAKFGHNIGVASISKTTSENIAERAVSSPLLGGSDPAASQTPSDGDLSRSTTPPSTPRTPTTDASETELPEVTTVCNLRVGTSPASGSRVLPEAKVTRAAVPLDVLEFNPVYNYGGGVEEMEASSLATNKANETRTVTDNSLASCPVTSGEIPEDRPTWTIYGRQYDLTKLLDSHPGGKWPLLLTKNSDCTILFESYHTFADRERLAKWMAQYEIVPAGGERRKQLPPPDPLQEDLRIFAREFFYGKANANGLKIKDAGSSTSSSSSKTEDQTSKEPLPATVGRPHHMSVTIFSIYLALYISCWVCVYFFMSRASLCAALLLPLLQWLYGASLAHDSSHFATFKDHRWNRIASFLGGCPLMYNSSAWVVQHVIQHHQFTNLIDDVDLFHFLPLIRASRLFNGVEKQSKFQLALILLVLPTTTLHLNFLVPLDLLTGNPVFIGPFDEGVSETEKFKLRYWQCRHLRSVVSEMWWPMALESVVVAFWWFMGVYMCGPFQYFIIFGPMCFLASMSFITFTQGAHIREECMNNVEENAKRRLQHGVELHPSNIAGFREQSEGYPALESVKSHKNHPNPLMGCWIREQIAYTADFRPDSWAWYLVSGGLNMQSIHHCMPGISHSHYTAMYPGYVKVLKKHGVEPKIVPTFGEFVWGFFRWIHELGNPNAEELDWATNANIEKHKNKSKSD
ncbi:unnamed protein product [Amoebophrya sp. A25]|nr:unnamed protein product [Amoebophrya sp. A25]|eukprot:GSA25T00000683001.1